MLINNFQEKIIFLIFFLAPTGTFFLAFAKTGSFRLFYILCLIYIIYSFLYRRKTYSKNLLIMGFVMFFATLFSVFWAFFFDFPSDLKLSLNPFLRFNIILILFLSFYFMFHDFISNNHPVKLYDLYKLSLFGFLTVFILGLMVYIPTLIGLISIEFWKKFVTIAQTAYGYLRFSPGTYPNEFGVLSSFFSIVSIMFFIIEKKYKYIIFLLIFLMGMALASTRISYVTFSVSILIVYVFYFRSKNLLLIFFTSLISIILLLIILDSYFNYNFHNVLMTGINSISSLEGYTQGSSAIRLEYYEIATDKFLKSPYLGLGFESPHLAMMHNLILQLLYGYGLFLSVVMVVIITLFVRIVRSKTIKNQFSILLRIDSKLHKYFKVITWVLFIHVFLFGLTNHNQAHFLTWLFFGQLLLNLNKKHCYR